MKKLGNQGLCGCGQSLLLSQALVPSSIPHGIVTPNISIPAFMSLRLTGPHRSGHEFPDLTRQAFRPVRKGSYPAGPPVRHQPHSSWSSTPWVPLSCEPVKLFTQANPIFPVEPTGTPVSCTAKPVSHRPYCFIPPPRATPAWPSLCGTWCPPRPGCAYT